MIGTSIWLHTLLLTQQLNWRFKAFSWIFCTHNLSVNASGLKVSYIKRALRKH